MIKKEKSLSKAKTQVDKSSIDTDIFPKKLWTMRPSHPALLIQSSVALCLWSVPFFRRWCQVLRWRGLWCGSWHPEQAACRLWLTVSHEALSHQLQSEHEHSAGAGDGPLQQTALHHPRFLHQHSESHKGTFTHDGIYFEYDICTDLLDALTFFCS